LKDLPAEWRSVVELRAGRGLSYREIAAAIGKSEAAVESILFRARERLAGELAPFLEGGGGSR
jgi:RNA polymerase sigma factor (sigma-70 family)